ncbi:MAG: TauD/TfdA family dioxygenase [Gammaproteobacteria bacterium]|nr:TauD/TfdA family dioxygenase [Gammaproteobacteria bacterium]
MTPDCNNPFDLNRSASYQQWRTRKFDLAQKTPTQPVEIANPEAITAHEHQTLSAQMAGLNMAIFRFQSNTAISSETLRTLGSQLGLNRLDSNLYANDSDISELQVIDKGRRGEYIPYTNRPLGWHTDGYYNHSDKTIRSFILYCVSDAEEGGVNQLLDPELAYIHLRDQSDELIEALMQPDTFIIPETIEAGKTIRPQQQNPVFQVDQGSGKLLMRYTQRKTHILWQQDQVTQTALSLLGGLLASDSDHILNIRLNPGEGLICNNVLHNRSAFIDSPEHPRIMLRARYYDRFRNYPNA